MDKAETIAGAGVLSIGALILAETVKLPYFLEGVPGPGFLPLWLSLGIIGAGITLTIKGVRAGILRDTAKWPETAGWRRMALMLGALGISFLVLNTLGFLITTTLFVAAVAFGLGARSWKMLASVPLLSAIVLYGVFAVWLRVPLPGGILSFLG